MHFLKKCKLICGLLLGFWCAGALAGGIQVKQAELVPVEDTYQLNAQFEIAFSPEVEEAINKGVPLNFLVEFQVVLPHRYWFDDEITSSSQSIRLGFHALSRQYLVSVGQQQKSFATLQEAREELSRVRDWIVLEKSQIVRGEPYQALLRFRLDQSRLPKALQVDKLGSEKWDLVSERHRWTPLF